MLRLKGSKFTFGLGYPLRTKDRLDFLTLCGLKTRRFLLKKKRLHSQFLNHTHPQKFSPLNGQVFMQYSVTNSTVKRRFFASRWCQLPLDSPDCSIELTCIHTHLRSFTQGRIQPWNPLLLCRCLGSVCSSLICVYFRPLTLLQTWRRSIHKGSAYRLVNGAVMSSLLTLIIAICRPLKRLSRFPLWSVSEARRSLDTEFLTSEVF